MGMMIKWGKKEPIQFENCETIVESTPITPILSGIDLLDKVEVSLNIRLLEDIILDVMIWNREVNKSACIEIFHPVDHRLGLNVMIDPIIKEEDYWLDEFRRQIIDQIAEGVQIHFTFRSQTEMVSKWGDMVEVYVQYKTWGGTTWAPINWLEDFLKPNYIRTECKEKIV